MNNLDKLNKLTEYHNYLKGATKFDLTVLEYIMREILALIEEENETREISLKKATNYIVDHFKK